MSDNQLIFRSFSSGSSGNCYYLGTSQWGVLIDAGISARTIQKNLREMGLDYANIRGVLITHDHADHIRAVGTLGERRSKKTGSMASKKFLVCATYSDFI